MLILVLLSTLLFAKDPDNKRSVSAIKIPTSIVIDAFDDEWTTVISQTGFSS